MNKVMNFINHWFYVYTSLVLLVIYMAKKNFIKYTISIMVAFVLYYAMYLTI
jgi:presenilin-like A22 family membrane protease